MATKEATGGGGAAAFEADVTREASMKAMIDACKAKWAASTSCIIMSASRSRAATRADRDHRGSLRPHHDGQFARHGDGGEARAAGHA